MTPKEKPIKEDKKLQTLDEICENTRAIRRVTNRILDHLHEYQTGASNYLKVLPHTKMLCKKKAERCTG